MLGSDEATKRRSDEGSVRKFVAALGLLLVGTTLLAGCGGTRVTAQFRLGPGSVMVFIDDPHERLDYPPTRRYIWEDLSQELVRTNSALRIVPIETEDVLRRSLPDFGKRGCRELGELAGAEQVVWIEIRDFLAEEMIVDSTNAAYLAATVRVINVMEKSDRRRVRLWPESPDGHHLNVSMTGAAAVQAKSKDGITKDLSAKLAVQVARLFHDHELLEFEKAP